MVNTYLLQAHTPHGQIEYSCMTKLVSTESLIPYMNKKHYDMLCEKGCPNYGKKWSCPPFAPKYDRFVQSYQYIQVVMLLVKMEQFDYIARDNLKIKAANSILKSRVDKALRQTMSEDEFYISTGSCKLCKPCKKKIDEKCAHPKRRSFSYEAMGIHVSAMTEALFCKELLWYKKHHLPEYTCVVAGLLTNDKEPREKVAEQLKRLN